MAFFGSNLITRPTLPGQAAGQPPTYTPGQGINEKNVPAGTGAPTGVPTPNASPTGQANANPISAAYSPTSVNTHDPGSVSQFLSYESKQPGIDPTVGSDPNYWMGKITSGELGTDPQYIIKKMTGPSGGTGAVPTGGIGALLSSLRTAMPTAGGGGMLGGLSDPSLLGTLNPSQALSVNRPTQSQAPTALGSNPNMSPILRALLGQLS